MSAQQSIAAANSQPLGRTLGLALGLSIVFAAMPLFLAYGFGDIPELAKAISRHLPNWLVPTVLILDLPIATVVFLENFQSPLRKAALGLAVVGFIISPACLLRATPSQLDRYFWWACPWVLIHSYLYLWGPGKDRRFSWFIPPAVSEGK